MTIPDDKMAKFLNVVFNQFFKKWKHRAVNFTEEDRRQAVDELDRIAEQGAKYPFVNNICAAVWAELEAIDHNGTTVIDPLMEPQEGFTEEV